MAFLDLDKTYTIRQILRRVVFVSLAVALLYFCLLIRRDWNVTMGGVGYGNSPYKTLIPEQCLKYSGVHTGSGGREPLAHSGLMAFQPRTYDGPLNFYVDRINCSGYEILTGLHGDYLAGYRVIHTKSNGEPLVIETVEYHTEQQSHNSTKKR
ncbi:MAG: hypothetical protein H7252_02750 [Cytophaga sp.]|nr:hypothetical protein [Undibacterium sp.]